MRCVGVFRSYSYGVMYVIHVVFINQNLSKESNSGKCVCATTLSRREDEQSLNACQLTLVLTQW